jgi:hypothetical protein
MEKEPFSSPIIRLFIKPIFTYLNNKTAHSYYLNFELKLFYKKQHFFLYLGESILVFFGLSKKRFFTQQGNNAQIKPNFSNDKKVCMKRYLEKKRF